MSNTSFPAPPMPPGEGVGGNAYGAYLLAYKDYLGLCKEIAKGSQQTARAVNFAKSKTASELAKVSYAKVVAGTTEKKSLAIPNVPAKAGPKPSAKTVDNSKRAQRRRLAEKLAEGRIPPINPSANQADKLGRAQAIDNEKRRIFNVIRKEDMSKVTSAFSLLKKKGGMAAYDYLVRKVVSSEGLPLPSVGTTGVPASRAGPPIRRAESDNPHRARGR